MNMLLDIIRLPTSSNTQPNGIPPSPTQIQYFIEIIDMAVNPDHVHLFIKYPPKYSVNYISKMIKGRSSRLLRKEFPHLKEWCGDRLWAPSCYHGSVGAGWDVVEKYISAHNTYEHNRR